MAEPGRADALREALRELDETLDALAERLRDAERLRARAAGLVETLRDGREAPAAGGPPGDERQAALLVALTVRGGTLPDEELRALAEELGVTPAALEELFDGADPLVGRRAGGAARLTERGLEAAEAWRPVLPPELREAATRF